MSHRLRDLLAATLTLSTLICNQALGQTTIYSEDFEGPANELLSGTMEDEVGEIWSANGFATTDGFLDVGQVEGSAVLPFTPAVGTIYNLSLDVTTDSDRWVGIGFSQNGSSEALNRPQDRFAQSGGISWFLLRPDFDTISQVEIFGGPNTDLIIADTDEDFFDRSVPTRSLTVVLDTTSDPTGASFDADFLIDGNSVSGGSQTIDVDISEINFAGFTFEGPNPNGFNGDIIVDNFLLTSDGTSFSPLDCSMDGSVGLDDVPCASGETIGEVLEAVNIVPGDFDLNGAVEFADFLILSGSFGLPVDSYADGDINVNGTVEFDDFLAFSANFGQSSAAVASVPEPNGFWALSAMIVMGAVANRRRR